MRALITGASGLIGTALLERLRGTHEIYCQSRRTHASEHGITWFKHDRSVDRWEDHQLPDLDVVFHLAGQTSVYVAREDPVSDLFSNVVWFVELLDFLRRQSVAPFVVLAATATEAGVCDTLPINENAADRPITFYDVSKLAAESYLQQYVREGWLKGCSLRLANVFGRSVAGQQKDRGIIDKIFAQAAVGRSVTIFGDGNNLRDYIFIDDVVSAFVMAAENSERTNGRLFYLGTGTGLRLEDAFRKVVARAEELTGARSAVTHVPFPASISPIELRSAVIDPSAFVEATGWAPRYDFDSALRVAFPDASGESSDGRR